MSASSDLQPAAGTRRHVVLPKNLHARPAGQVAQAAARHEADITILVGDRRANARSVLAVMGLGVTIDTEICVLATGPQAEHAADDIARILAEPE